MVAVNETRTFGVEIEAYGIDQHVLATAITEAGVPCYVEEYNHITRAHWKIVPDGSLVMAHAFELVSPPLCGAEGLAQLETVCTVLHRLHAKLNKRCGLHVHHDARTLSLEAWRCLITLYAEYEPVLDSLMPPSRRNNPYCQSLLRSHSLATLTAHCAAAHSLQQLSVLVYNGDRYYKVNLQSFWRHGTVEFRQHSGTVEYAKIAAWISLTQALVESARQRTDGPLVEATVALGLGERNTNRDSQLAQDIVAYVGTREAERGGATLHDVYTAMYWTYGQRQNYRENCRAHLYSMVRAGALVKHGMGRDAYYTIARHTAPVQTSAPPSVSHMTYPVTLAGLADMLHLDNATTSFYAARQQALARA